MTKALDPNYAPVSTHKFQEINNAFRDCPQTDGRFSGTPEQQKALAEKMRDLFVSPGDNTMLLKHDDTLGLADDLENAASNWSIGQYSAALATLIKPEGE